MIAFPPAASTGRLSVRDRLIGQGIGSCMLPTWSVLYWPWRAEPVGSLVEAMLPVGWAHGDRYSEAQWAGPKRYA